MILDFYKNIYFFIGVIYFSILLKNNKLVSAEYEFYHLRKIVKKNQNVIDVGANIGRYSFKLSKLVGKNGLVYAFEPMNKSFLTFLALITFSKVKNILPFNFALSNKSNFVFMKELESSQKKNYIFGTQTESKIVNKKKNSIVKYCIELDKIDIKKKISFIKIDCEGFELEVLQGSKRLIKKNKPIILFEYNDNKKVINYLKSLGYNEILKKQKSRNKLFAHKKNYDFKKSI